MFITAGTRCAYRPWSPQDGRSSAAVGSSLPALGMLAAPGPREDCRMIAAVASPPRAPGVFCTPGSRVDDTSRNFPRAPCPTSHFEAPTIARRDSQDARVALRCRFGSTGPSRSTRALRSRCPRKTGRNLPLSTINEEGRIIFSSDFHPDQSAAAGFFWAHGVSPEATEPVGNKCPPQGFTTTTPLALKCAPPYPDESRRGDLRQQTPRASRAVLTTPFAVDPLKMPPAYTADVSPTQSG